MALFLSSVVTVSQIVNIVYVDKQDNTLSLTSTKRLVSPLFILIFIVSRLRDAIRQVLITRFYAYYFSLYGNVFIKYVFYGRNDLSFAFDSNVLEYSP